MENCFVIQPFDRDIFDRRYKDIFSPAITNAGLTPYRIDEDPAVRIPIEDIEKGIADSAICFAEITTDNPNVWYELGFAIALGKDVILVCSDERSEPFPFDIRHRQIVKYKTKSKSDYSDLEDAITNKIRAYQQTGDKVKTLSHMPVVPTQGLQSHEVAILILIMQNSLTPEEWCSIFMLQNEMRKAGYTDIATSMGVRTLSKTGLIEISVDSDYNNNTYSVCKLTKEGESWMMLNQHLLEYRSDSNQSPIQQASEDEELPF